jgi:hypothetical protein
MTCIERIWDDRFLWLSAVVVGSFYIVLHWPWT